ncbi:MAG: hypothetical protein EXR62_10345 [Chloroflexi bacterium]|nr:hypothetical protein [Chloroflexota bacterium]
MPAFEVPFVNKYRRHHAIEHATIHVLTRDYPYLQLIGRATNRGFLVYGEVSAEALKRATAEALLRLQSGEVGLAIHPRCGTNLAVTGLLAGGMAFVASLEPGSQKNASITNRLPAMLLASLIAVFLALPLGPLVQEKITTATDVGHLHLVDIQAQPVGRMPVHHVLLS